MWLDYYAPLIFRNKTEEIVVDQSILLENKVIEILQSQLESETDIQPSTTFNELQLNSIGFVKAVVQIEDDLSIGFDLKMIDIEQYSTVKDMIDYVKQLKNI